MRAAVLAVLCTLAGSALGASPDVVDGPRDGGRIVGDGIFARPPTLAAAGVIARDEPASQSGKDFEAGTFRIGGFYALETAYTFSDPSHWSRAVNRFQLVGEGSISGDVKYKLGARLDVDPVYFNSGFYPAAVKRDQRFDIIWRENYLDVTAGNWAFRVGAQNIVWGEVIGLFFADVVSAHDLRDFLLPPFDVIRVPQWAARAEYYLGDAHLELIWIPVPTFDKIGKPGGEFYPLALPLPASEAAVASVAPVERPSRSISNSNYGIRANTLAGGWDVSAFYYRSLSTDPTFYRVQGAGPAIFQPRYDRLWQAGGTASKDFDTFVLRAEGVYSQGRSFPTVMHSSEQGAERHATLDYIVSIDFPTLGGGRFNFQAFQRHYFGGSGNLALDSGNFGISGLFSTKLGARLEPQLLWIQTFGGGGGLIRPRVNWQAERNLHIAVGADIFTGGSAGYFGRFDHRDRVYTEVRYDF